MYLWLSSQVSSLLLNYSAFLICGISFSEVSSLLMNGSAFTLSDQAAQTLIGGISFSEVSSLLMN